ncbi:DNA-binding SARP family transcriptional activator [Kribbella sp. VKM Ac-2569]|uniref:BTAD domain-containing putative transcriptional regulator n=1 Tax=Kribbella sp. VKM Ac-2569 TaxID=2512220 RepID=UPI00102C2475|nr:BTAD domain-containing putative transcriptional regulator [Kribbella sp. VKM Ac-2569]RZT16717.1 DNA-binding SARP family transcriptional activator [Kribbella sp. VKM Ac-2569]
MPRRRQEEPTIGFGALLRRLRQGAGVTQRDLAERAGVSIAAIRDLEQGRTRSPKVSSIEALANALDLTAPETETLQTAAKTHRPVAVPGAAGPVYVGVLGPLEVRTGDLAVPVNSAPQRTLLARLALTAGTTVAQDELVDLLWPRGAPSNAVNLLQTRVARLRRLLESGRPAVIVGGRTGYRLALDDLDLLQFRELITEAARADPEIALAKLASAVDLWRGDSDVDAIAHSPLYAAVVNEYTAAVRAFAALARDLGEPEQALEPLRGLALRHEFDEPLHVELIQTLAAAGRQVEALAAYDRIRTALVDHLGIDPGERLRAVHLEVLRQQTGSPAEPSTRVVVQQAPSAPPDFVGRAAELETIRTALGGSSGVSSRAVLINGIAGVGKTALALTAAHQLREQYPDGQLYADLRGSDTTTPAPVHVLGRFLRALGVPGRRIGTDEAEAAALLRSELADRRMLVLLDNAQDAAQVRPLLPGAGRSDVIVTSRRRMPDLLAAGVVSLEPLPQEDAVRLIASTARTPGLDADLEGVRALVEACARLPLALRIAGARLATRQEWTVADLAGRLDDGNRRLTELSLGESSVLNSFQLSYADLSADAQRAFRMCSLHPGDDFSAESTAILLRTSTAEAERVLESLLEANMLLQHSKDRYRFHDLLGLYSRRLLAEDPEHETARTRLHSWYAEAVTAAIDWAYPQLLRLDAHGEADWYFASEDEALAWLDHELPALLAVVQGAAKSGEGELAWRIVDQLRGYFLLRRDADGWLPAARAGLDAATAAGDDRACVAMLINRAQAFGAVGRDADALSDCLAASALAVGVGWSEAAAYVAHQTGWLQLERGMLVDAELWMRRATELTADDQRGHIRAIVVNGLGMIRLHQGELAEAADLFAAALKLNETGRETSALANRGNLASALRQLGEVDRAAGLLDDVLTSYQRRSHVRGELSTLDELARLYSQRGEGTAALRTALRAHQLAIVVRDRKAQAQTASAVAEAHLALGDATAAIDWIEDCLTIARATYPFLETHALLTLSTAQTQAGNPTAAVNAATQAASIAHTHGFHLLNAQAAAVLPLHT